MCWRAEIDREFTTTNCNRLLYTNVLLIVVEMGIQRIRCVIMLIYLGVKDKEETEKYLDFEVNL